MAHAYFDKSYILVGVVYAKFRGFFSSSISKSAFNTFYGCYFSPYSLLLFREFLYFNLSFVDEYYKITRC